jgi:hypothetical protein
VLFGKILTYTTPNTLNPILSTLLYLFRHHHLFPYL